MICPNPQIVAARLIATRNIFLRQQLCQIANEIQRQYDRRLPLLHLVTTAVYEQVFYRQVTMKSFSWRINVNIFVSSSFISHCYFQKKFVKKRWNSVLNIINPTRKNSFVNRYETNFSSSIFVLTCIYSCKLNQLMDWHHRHLHHHHQKKKKKTK